MRIVVLTLSRLFVWSFLGVVGCGETATASMASTAAVTTSTTDESGGPRCDVLFGQPNEATGLTAEMCRPECLCQGGWVAPTYDAADVADLRSRTLLEPFSALSEDPYETSEPPQEASGEVCGVLSEPTGYRVRTYADAAAAGTAGAIVTHTSACGLCSPLQDLAVYMANPDLTAPVRACALVGLSQGDEANLACLIELGFTMPCAQIWLFNTINTRVACLDVCLDALDDPYQLPDGSLNACLQCDEDNSGPVFKAVAGRTRRNTGVPNALCRPCDSVAQLEHEYGP